MLNIKKIDEFIFKFIKKYSLTILFLIITIISILMRIKCIDIESADYNNFLINWYNQIKENGGFLALGEEIGDYNISYILIIAFLTYIPIRPLIAIKLVSILFDYSMAIVGMLLIYELLKKDKFKHLYALITYCILVILPSTVLNSSMWAQCDSIYTTFVLLSLLYLIKEKNIKAFIFLGIAFSFKLQTIFVLPVFILVYISKRKFQLCYFLIIPIINLVMCLPAIIMGRTIESCFDIYVNQVEEYSTYISMNFPNIYAMLFDTIGESNLIYNLGQEISRFGTLATISIFSIVAILVIYNETKINNELLIELTLWSVLLCTFLLPSMHDRYLYIADVISIIYFAITRKKIYIPIIVNFISLYVYVEYLYGSKNLPIEYVAIANAIILIIITKDIILKINNKKIEKEVV